MNDRRKRWMSRGGGTAALAAALFFSITLNVFGAGALTEVKVYLNSGIKLMLNGSVFEPKDEDGLKLVPITYRGSTYLPLRAVAEAAGLEVAWDGKTNTAYLGDTDVTISEDGPSYVKLTPDFMYNGNERYRQAGQSPEELTPKEGVAFSYGYVTAGYRSVTMEVNNDFTYDEFKAKIWAEDAKYDDLQIKIFDENKVTLKEMTVDSGTLTELELNIKNVKTLWVQVQGDASIVGEPMIAK